MPISVRVRTRALVAALIAANIAAAVYLVRRRERGPLAWLSGLRAAGGQRVPALAGSPVYVAIHRSGYSLDLLGLDWAASVVPRDAHFLVLTNAGTDALPLLRARPGSLIIRADLQDVSRRLGVGTGLDRWLYISASGQVLAAGDLDNTGIVSVFGARTEVGRSAAAAQLAGIISKLDAAGGFRYEHARAAGNREREYVELFLNSACSGCRIADTIRKFQAYASADREAFGIATPDTWTQSDLRVLTQNMGVVVPVRAASHIVSITWGNFTGQYGVLRSNGFVVAFRQQGFTAAFTPAATEKLLRRAARRAKE